MEKRHKRVIMIILAAMLVVSVIAVAYAYYMAPIRRTNQTGRVTTGTLILSLDDATNAGFSEAIHFGDTRTTRFTIENTGTLDASVNIYWKDIVNTYLQGSLVYTLSYGDENTQEANYTTIVSEANVPRSATASDKILLENFQIPADTTYNYKLDITLVNSPTVDQTADLNATFYSEFTIKEYDHDGSKTLAALGIIASMSTPQNPGFGFISPYSTTGCTYNGYNVRSAANTAEACETVYESTDGTGYAYADVSYVNAALSEMSATFEYVGNAVWDETNETCTYNGNQMNLIYPMLSSEIVAAKGKGCSEVYNIKVGDNIVATGTGIKNVGPGQYGAVNQASGIYSYEDDYGTSYYYRGDVTNNYVKFGKYSSNYKIYKNGDYEYPTLALCEARHGSGNCNIDNTLAGEDMYWRIVRINGDGSIRMIYDGTSTHASGDDSTDRLALQSVHWNLNNFNDAKYVGYMYGGSNGVASTSKAQAQTNETNSNMKNVLEAWYENVFAGTQYEEYISDEIFCNDRSTPIVDGEIGYNSGSTPYTTLGYGTNDTAYGARARMVKHENPKLTCTNKNDAFTARDTVRGNGMSAYPIGLITADEMRLAGGYWENNTDYYLNKGNYYWGFSPYNFYDGNAYVFGVSGNGLMRSYNVYYDEGVAPVINLSAESASLLVGDGTTTSPYHFE